MKWKKIECPVCGNKMEVPKSTTSLCVGGVSKPRLK